MRLAFFLLLTPLAFAAPRPVILSTDCGADMDDQWALAHLALAPELQLLGVVTTHAPDLQPPRSQNSAKCATEVLSKLSLASKPPVMPGSAEPLTSRYRAQRNAGVDFIIDQSKRHQNLAVVVIGAATDIASALLLDAGLSRRIEVVAMGFDGWPAGGDPYNVKNDVAAWQVLMESGVDLTVGDIAVTTRHLSLSTAQAQDLIGARGVGGAFLARVQRDFVEKHPDIAIKATGKRDTWPVWDAVTVAHLLRLTKYDEHSRPGMRNDMTFLHTEPCRSGCKRSPTIKWITSIDHAALWKSFTDNLDRARAR